MITNKYSLGVGCTCVDPNKMEVVLPFHSSLKVFEFVESDHDISVVSGRYM